MTQENMQTVERTETKLVGYTVTVSLNEDLETRIVVSLREKLISNLDKITNRLDHNGIYLVQIYPDEEWTPDVAFESIIAVEVTEFLPLPEGFVQRTVPAGTYVKISHKGAESHIEETYNSIREQGIAAFRSFDVEYWADNDALEKEDNIIEIYLPL
ncbi:GyrI-like domain-containing protein [Paenibacillus endoradicis]|uniref:GyrI-like domain-containing protein n=1 Tax=Paenibacillus endoradicis TaxID=2972487 RepID=UPI002158CA48|nr:GyrI-like domain-containing protein [Paenibacillus endoradicis]MCR8657413.1 GyrI-like domain-containing protein [Paenibacillus endoradicis]